MEGTIFLYHLDFIIILCCSFSSDIEISKQQMPKKIAEVAKEATILDYEVTRIEHGTKPLSKKTTSLPNTVYYFKHINL